MDNTARMDTMTIGVDGAEFTFKLMYDADKQPTVFGWSADAEVTGHLLRKALIALGRKLEEEMEKPA